MVEMIVSKDDDNNNAVGGWICRVRGYLGCSEWSRNEAMSGVGNAGQRSRSMSCEEVIVD